MEQLVALTRTNLVESIHHGLMCITDENNNVLYHLGNPEDKIFFRSSAKPIQAIGLVDSGALEHFKITQEELAIICSSHSGEDFHQKIVSSLLDKIGASEQELECGCCDPYNKQSLDGLIQGHQRPSTLHNCCSGKHAGMLALCKFYGYPTTRYTEPDHPVQQRILQVIAELLQCSRDDLTVGADNCGTPSVVLTLHQASYLYALLAAGYSGKTKYASALGRIQEAILAHPQLLNGDKEFCTDLIIHSNRRVIGKVGGEGIYSVCVPEKRLGITVKIYDGNERGVYPVTTHILKQLGVLGIPELEKLRSWAYPPIKDHRGVTIGFTYPIFDIHGNTETVKIGQQLHH